MLVYLLITLLLYSIKAQIIIENKDIYLSQGIVRGEVKYVAGKSVNIFLGIPYAEPPIGPLRFLPPVPHKPWTDPTNVTLPEQRCCVQITNEPDEDEVSHF